ncbi:LuxR C-terminal-related transcriptional regulator [Aquabacterium sp.]|uniref:LuxR C-terminal-related transcriptional regulator n=1 Tax=Aquabacterium sp. TaxID=1872578 RepID=UPI003D6CE495
MDHHSPHYLLVDDHSLIREGMMHAIRSLQPSARFSQANTCRGALSQLAGASADPIDAILLDLGLPDSSGVDTLKHVRQVAPTQRIGIITGSTDAQLALECIHHGASCFIPKLGELDGFMTALQALVEGRLHFPADLLSNPGAMPDSPDLVPSVKLTPRQKDVLTWITRGCSNPVIATALGISPETVKLHVSAIFRAYKVHSRTQLVLLCSRQAPAEEQLP